MYPVSHRMIPKSVRYHTVPVQVMILIVTTPNGIIPWWSLVWEGLRQITPNQPMFPSPHPLHHFLREDLFQTSCFQGFDERTWTGFVGGWRGSFLGTYRCQKIQNPKNARKLRWRKHVSKTHPRLLIDDIRRTREILYQIQIISFFLSLPILS